MSYCVNRLHQLVLGFFRILRAISLKFGIVSLGTGPVAFRGNVKVYMPWNDVRLQKYSRIDSVYSRMVLPRVSRERWRCVS
jgi:hypothetical protein